MGKQYRDGVVLVAVGFALGLAAVLSAYSWGLL